MIELCHARAGPARRVGEQRRDNAFCGTCRFEAMTEAKWDEILAVNLKGPFFRLRAAIPVMRATGGGAIVKRRLRRRHCRLRLLDRLRGFQGG